MSILVSFLILFLDLLVFLMLFCYWISMVEMLVYWLWRGFVRIWDVFFWRLILKDFKLVIGIRFVGFFGWGLDGSGVLIWELFGFIWLSCLWKLGICIMFLGFWVSRDWNFDMVGFSGCLLVFCDDELFLNFLVSVV